MRPSNLSEELIRAMENDQAEPKAKLDRKDIDLKKQPLDDGDSGLGFREQNYNSPETEHGDRKTNVHADGNLSSELTQALIRDGAEFASTGGAKGYYGRELVDFVDAEGDNLSPALIQSNMAWTDGSEAGNQAELAGIMRRASGYKGTGNDIIDSFSERKSKEKFNPSRNAQFDGNSYSTRSNLSKSFERGSNDTKAALGGALNWLGDLTNNSELTSYGKEFTAKAKDANLFNEREIKDFSKVNSIEDGLTYLVETTGEMAPGLLFDAIATVGTGGTGLVAGVALRAAGKKVIIEAGKKGLISGPAVSGFIQSVGNMENTLEEGGSEVNTGAATLSGVVGAAANTLPFMAVFPKLAKSAGLGDEAVKGISARLKDIGTTTAIGGFTEGIASTAQELIDKVIAHETLDTKWTLDTTEFIDNAIRSVLGGGSAAGIGSGIAHSTEKIVSEYQTRQNDATEEKKGEQERAAMLSEQISGIEREIAALRKAENAGQDAFTVDSKTKALDNAEKSIPEQEALKAEYDSNQKLYDEQEKEQQSLYDEQEKELRTEEDASIGESGDRAADNQRAWEEDLELKNLEAEANKAGRDLAYEDKSDTSITTNSVQELENDLKRLKGEQEAAEAGLTNAQLSQAGGLEADDNSVADPKENDPFAYTRPDVPVPDFTAHERVGRFLEGKPNPTATDLKEAIDSGEITREDAVDYVVNFANTPDSDLGITDHAVTGGMDAPSKRQLVANINTRANQLQTSAGDIGNKDIQGAITEAIGGLEAVSSTADLNKAADKIDEAGRLIGLEYESKGKKAPKIVGYAVKRKDLNQTYSLNSLSKALRGEGKSGIVETKNDLPTENVDNSTDQPTQEVNNVDGMTDEAKLTVLQDVKPKLYDAIAGKAKSGVYDDDPQALTKDLDRAMKKVGKRRLRRILEVKKETTQVGDALTAAAELSGNKGSEQSPKEVQDAQTGELKASDYEPKIQAEQDLQMVTDHVAELGLDPDVTAEAEKILRPIMGNDRKVKPSSRPPLITPETRASLKRSAEKGTAELLLAMERNGLIKTQIGDPKQQYATRMAVEKPSKNAVTVEVGGKGKPSSIEPSAFTRLGRKVVEGKRDTKDDMTGDAKSEDANSLQLHQYFLEGLREFHEKTGVFVDPASFSDDTPIGHMRGHKEPITIGHVKKNKQRIQSIVDKSRTAVVDGVDPASLENTIDTLERTLGREESGADASASDTRSRSEKVGDADLTPLARENLEGFLGHLYTMAGDFSKLRKMVGAKAAKELTSIKDSDARMAASLKFFDIDADTTEKGMSADQVSDTFLTDNTYTEENQAFVGHTRDEAAESKTKTNHERDRSTKNASREISATKQKAALDRDQSADNTKLEDLEREIATKESELAERQAARGKAEDAKAHDSALATRDKHIDEAETELSDLRTEVGTLSTTIEQRQSNIDRLDSSLKKDRGEASQSKVPKSSHANAPKIVAKSTDKRQEVATLETQQVQQGIDAKRVAEKQAEVKRLRKLAADKRKLIKEHKAGLKERKADRDKKARAERTQATLKATKARRLKDEGEALPLSDKAEAKIADSSEKAQKTRAERVQQNRKDRTERKGKAKERKAKRDELRAKLRKDKHGGETSWQEKQLKDTYEKIARLRKEISDIQSVMAKRQKRIAALEKRLVTKSRELASARLRVEAARPKGAKKIMHSASKFFRSVNSRIHGLSPTLARRLFRAGGDQDSANSFQDARRQKTDHFFSQIAKAFGEGDLNVDRLNSALDGLLSGKHTDDSRKLQMVIKKLNKYANEVNPLVELSDVPILFKSHEVNERLAELESILADNGVDDAASAAALIRDSDGVPDGHITMGQNSGYTGQSSLAKLVADNPTLIKLLRDKGFINDYAPDVVAKYVAGIVKRVETDRALGKAVRNDKGEVISFNPTYHLDRALDAYPKGAERVELLNLVKATLGIYNQDVNPALRTFNAVAIGFNNVTLLLFSAVASIPELMLPFARSKEINTSMRGMESIIKSMATSKGRKEMRQFADDLDVMNDLITKQTLMDLYNSNELTIGRFAHKATDILFRVNQQYRITGMARVAGAFMARRFMTEHAAGTSKDSARYLRELGISAGDIQIIDRYIDKDGSVPTTVPMEHRAALENYRKAANKYIHEAALTPNSSQLPLYAADPRFAVVSHLNNYFYAFWSALHKGVIGTEFKQKGMGYSPTLAMHMAGFMGLAAVSASLRAVIKGQDNEDEEEEPMDKAWKLFGTAGMLGPFQRLESSYQSQGWGRNAMAAFAGPTADLLVNDVMTGDMFTHRPSRMLPVVNQLPWLKRPVDRTWRGAFRGTSFDNY